MRGESQENDHEPDRALRKDRILAAVIVAMGAPPKYCLKLAYFAKSLKIIAVFSNRFNVNFTILPNLLKLDI